MTWLALDIGGANLKAADGRGWTFASPFALWRQPDRLASALDDILNRAPPADRIAVTMTGELCDAFRTKAEGVRHILSAVEEAARTKEVQIYLVDGRLVSTSEAREAPRLAAASNWHALARFAARFAMPGPALMVDIGSTTTDIIPLVNGRPASRGLNDTDRLIAGELVYGGVGRTPICSQVRTLPWQGMNCPVAAELFATTEDVYVLRNEVAEQPENTNTADGRPLTKEFAQERLARMICADSTIFGKQDAEAAADFVRQSQLARITAAVREVVKNMPSSPCSVIISGAGEFLAHSAADAALPNLPILALSARIGPEASRCAPAHALAVLAAEND
jgi:probable H4MPT-linked C1 transfer pathway protein